MNDLTIGEKIKMFRKRAGITQFELELKIGAASGSVSHMEKGDTNPSKETLVKIIDALNLQAKDAAFLFDIEIEGEFTKLVNFSKKFNTLNLNEVISNFVNDIVHELKLTHSALVWIKEGDMLKSTQLTKNWYTELIFKLLPIPLSLVNISLVDPKFNGNLIRQAAINKKMYADEILYKFGIGLLDSNLLDKIQKMMRIKIIVVIPMIIEDECIGVVGVSWVDKNKYREDLSILQAFTNLLTATINNIYKYNALQQELNNLKK